MMLGGLFFIVVLYSVKVALKVRQSGSESPCRWLWRGGVYILPGSARGQSAARCGKISVQLWQCRRYIQLSKLKRIELKNCTYENGETALDNNDISLLQEQNAGVKIVIE